MGSIIIPTGLKAAFGVSEPTRVCDESGTILGYYTPVREATEDDYEWAMQQMTKEQMEASLKSGPTRPAAEVIAELRRKYGP